MQNLVPTNFRFTALQTVDLPKKHAAAFDLAWRIMRDNFYDSKLGNNANKSAGRSLVVFISVSPNKLRGC